MRRRVGGDGEGDVCGCVVSDTAAAGTWVHIKNELGGGVGEVFTYEPGAD